MKTIEKFNTSTGEFEYELFRKNIKNLHISVYPPTGGIRVSAPIAFDLSKIEVSLLRKMQWIKKQQKLFDEQPRLSPRSAVSGEDLYLQGRRFQLELKDGGERGKILIKGKKIILSITQESTLDSKLRCIDRWYRQLLMAELNLLVPELMEFTGLSANTWCIRKMKARWGNYRQANSEIVLNTELIKKSTSCLRFIIIHELIHTVEPSHNARFVERMDHYLPNWRSIKKLLNSQPLAYTNWDY